MLVTNGHNSFYVHPRGQEFLVIVKQTSQHLFENELGLF